MRRRPLYGGAFSISLEPRFFDVSLIRQIGDHEEVWTDAKTDQTWITELLEREDDEKDESAIQYHYSLLAKGSNQASQVQILESLNGRRLTEEEFPVASKYFCSVQAAIQLISKLKDSQERANEIVVFMVLVRMDDVDTDILITLSAPTQINARSKCKGATVQPFKDVLEMFFRTIKTFRINSMTIFGVDE